MVTFWAILENINFKKKTAAAAFWATFGKRLGYFLFQHLVTLPTPHNTASRTNSKYNVENMIEGGRNDEETEEAFKV